MKKETVNRLWLYAMGALIVAGGVWGFGHKFYALVTLALQKDGPVDAAFAVAPVVNYLLASFGFLCLVGWAAMHGMFHDIEGPKYTLLEVEAELDAATNDADYSKSVME